MNTLTEPQARPRLQISAPPPAAQPSRAWVRLSWLAGVALLTASLVGASHVLQSRPNSTDAANREGKVGAERGFSGPPGVICLGTWDLENTPGGFVPLTPLQPGEVTAVLVTENQVVKKGDLLLKMDDELQVQSVALAETGVRLAQAQVAEAQQAATAYQAGIDAQKAAVDAAKHKIAAADYRLHRERQKFEAVNETQTSNRDELNAVTEENNSAKSMLAAEEARLRAVQANKPDVKVHQADENLVRARLVADQARQALKRCTLEAPADGTVLRIAVTKGAVLGPQTRQAPILFAPIGLVVVRAEVEQEFAHRVQAGMSATITDEANGQVTWHGRVKRLGAAYLPKRSAGGPESFALGGSEPRVLECLVELDPGQAAPMLGQRVRVNIGTHGGP
jgi:multidrug resistance efflux pump